MAVRIRLARAGAKKQPFYRIVAADSRSPRDGRFIEILGRYNPRTEPSTVEVDLDKVKAWIAKGAQPSETVAKLVAIAEGTKEAPTTPKPKSSKKATARADAAAKAAEKPAEPAAEAAPAELPAEEPAAEEPAAESEEAPSAEEEPVVEEAPADEPAAEDAAAAEDVSEEASEADA